MWRDPVWLKAQHKWSTNGQWKGRKIVPNKTSKISRKRSYSTQNLKFFKQMWIMLKFPEKYVKPKKNRKTFSSKNRNMNLPLLNEVEPKATDSKISIQWTSIQLTQCNISKVALLKSLEIPLIPPHFKWFLRTTHKYFLQSLIYQINCFLKETVHPKSTSKYKEKLEIKNCKKYQKKERETIKNYTEVEKLQAPSKWKWKRRLWRGKIKF